MNEVFDLLDKEFLALSIYWDLQRELFRSQDPQDSKAFEWGAHAWSYLNRGLIDSMFIIVGRLMDPSMSGKKENLSLARMLECLPVGRKKGKIVMMVEKVRSEYNAKIKPWRHQVIAHADLETAKNRAVLPNLPFAEFDEVVRSILAIARQLHLFIRHSDNDFSVSILFKDGPRAILETMRLGNGAREAGIAERKRRFGGGSTPA